MLKVDIEKSLINLDVQELIEIKNRIEFLLKSEKRGPVNIDDFSTFYNIVADQLIKIAGIRSIPYSIYLKSKGAKKMREAKTFIDTILKDTIQRPDKRTRVQFYMLYAKVMLAYLDKYEIPKSITSLFNVYDRFSSQMDNAFPSYGAIGYSLLIGKGEVSCAKK